ncbi:MAG: hypothetical protein A2Z88_00135 [Omnitrophica WOR_2 bacterium GWA2_47_8]|nr:MAG: hypothetical protein A2Z88_00135 [Omnitrophica WOR_2 bacterium GWA2_47_8]
MEPEVRSEIENIKKQLEFLMERQEHLEDALLSPEDEKALQEARKDFEEGKTTELSDLKKKLGL